ncbi:MAG: ATP-binding protein [Verrucomicrobia bacterium]|nr:ATP-binding protein [Verrucomicrobiota bacterium]
MTFTFQDRLFSEPKGSYFLFGPRGTGKSTWLKKYHANALWIDLLQAVTFREFSARPERLQELVDAHSEKATIVIDEIQRVPELLTVVHSIIEQKTNKKFVLTGSSARKLKRTGVDLLAGRAVLRSFHPFMAMEIPAQFQLESALTFGTLPLVMASSDPQDILNAYVATYLQEEVQAEGLVRNVGEFARFLEVIAFSHAEQINITNIAKECEVERKTVSSFVTILEDLLLAFQLTVFTKRAKRELSSHNKLYLFDAGVYRSLRPRGPLDRREEIDGHALEGLVAQHLRAWIGYSGKDCRLFFWRTRHGLEVDFVLYGADLFCAIEVKNSNKVSPQDLKSLKHFQEDYPECTPYLLYRGKDRLVVDGILCIPCQEFLLQLDPRKEQIYC